MGVLIWNWNGIMEMMLTIMVWNLTALLSLMFIGWVISLTIRNVTIVDTLWGSLPENE